MVSVWSYKDWCVLKLKPTKCHLIRRGVTFLKCCVIWQNNDWSAVQNIASTSEFKEASKLPWSSCLKQIVHLWIGFSITVESLYILCKKNVPFCWQQKQQAAFEKIKDRQVSLLELPYPNFSLAAGSFTHDTKASQLLAIRAVFHWQQQDRTKWAIAYGNRSLNEQDRNHCNTRLEMQALATYVDYFR